MKTEYKLAIGFIIIIALVIGYAVYESQQPGQYDELAQCINDSGATFYGAFWCPHCQSQRAMFGKSEALLPYVECSTPDRQSQLPVCNEAGVQTYPTWEFAGGERLEGVQQIETLAAQAGCALPQ